MFDFDWDTIKDNLSNDTGRRDDLLENLRQMRTQLERKVAELTANELLLYVERRATEAKLNAVRHVLAQMR